jgi:hypothetical protein
MRVDWDNENTKIPVSHKVENAKLQCNLEKWISMRTFNSPRTIKIHVNLQKHNEKAI